MDLFRPVKPQTISHNKYTLIIVDEYSRYTWVFCLKKKSDAAECIMSFIRKMENLNEVRVKELRSDNGTEFKNHKLEEFCDEKGISQNFSYPCTPEQNGVADTRNKILIEAVRTMLNSVKLPIQFWGEAVNTACYTQNRSIIVKRHKKTSYDVFRGRSLDISYFYVFGCPVHIHNHRDHLGKFDEKADDGFFLGYSPVAKAFRVFNIRRQKMEETIHVTFSEDDEAISQSSTEGDAINFNENRSFPDDEFLEPRSEVTQCLGNTEYFPYILAYENITPSETPILQESIISEDPPMSTKADNHLAINEPDQTESADLLEPPEPQTNVIHEPIIDVQPSPSTKMEPKKLIEALEEKGWIIAMQEELNQFGRNKEVLSQNGMRKMVQFMNGKVESQRSVGSFDLKAYSDSEYAGCNLDRKSTLRGCQILGGKLVCWSAKKQSSIAMSSLKLSLIDHILKGDIELHFVPTYLQLADIFTKPLAEPRFTRLVAELGLLNIEKQVSEKKQVSE
ncbi:retrovirus-related pol polyprotein from transposon TNT 1-94 [Tanacetum coccineum]